MHVSRLKRDICLISLVLVRELIQRLPSGPFAAPSSPTQALLEDYSIKGESERQEKESEAVEAKRRRKGKAIVVLEDVQDFNAYANLESQIEAPEEGEMVEKYVPQSMDPIEVHVSLGIEENEFEKVDEFVDEAAYDNDCLGDFVRYLEDEEAVRKDQVNVAIWKQLRLVKMQEMIAKRSMELKAKVRDEWDKARKIFSRPEVWKLVNDNSEVVGIFKLYRSFNHDIHHYYSALCQGISALSVSTGANNGWYIIINFTQYGMKVISTDLLHQLPLTELFVLRRSIRLGSNVNELLKDMITGMMEKACPEVHKNPPTVKYFKGNLVQNLTLGDSLMLYPLKNLEYVERRLRSEGFRSEEKKEATDLIYAYRLNIASELGKDLTKVKPIWSSQPVKPFTDRATVDALTKRGQAYEQHLIDNPLGAQFDYPPIEESTPQVPIEEPITEEQLQISMKVFINPLRVIYTTPNNVEMTLKVSKLHAHKSKFIEGVLGQLKTLTNYLDNLALNQVTCALELKIREEIVMDTQRVMNHPKRFVVKGNTQTLRHRFKKVSKMQNLSYMRIVLDGLEEPTNSLEQETYDLVSKRIIDFGKEKMKTLKSVQSRGTVHLVLFYF